MIIYIDWLFLINFISSYVMISIMALFKRASLSYARKTLSAAAGSAFALLIFLTNASKLKNILLYTASATTVCAIAFGGSKKAVAKNTATFLLLTLLTTSTVMLCISIFGNNTGLFLKNNIIYFDISSKVMLCSFVLSYPIICFFSKLLQQRAHKQLYKLTIFNGPKSISVTALFDSGNLLKEPVSGNDVIILERIFAEKITADGQQFIQIPYSTVDSSSYLTAFAPDMVIVDDKHLIRRKYIGITDICLSDTGEYNALIGNIGGF